MFLGQIQLLSASGDSIQQFEMYCLQSGHGEWVLSQVSRSIELTMYDIASNSTPPVIPPGALGFSTLLSSVSSKLQMVLFGWQKTQK